MPDANQPRPLLLFLSHAGIDTEAARALKQRLEAVPEARERGLRVWFDKDDLRAGEPWQAQLEEAIRHRSAAFTVYVGSRGVVNWVDAEIQLALSRAVTDPAYRFIPILAPQAPGPEALPGFVALYQGVADVENRPDQFAKLVAAILGQDATGTAKLEGEPFFGLKAIDEDRAHLFFGREQETEALLQLLRRDPLVMVTGDSGSGKSSLVRAGLVPRWRGGALAEALGERPADIIWHVVQTQPRTRPFQTLAEAINEAAKRLGLPLADRGTLENWARSGDPDQVRSALRCDLSPDRTRILLLIDQFEELVTIAEPAEREPFVRLLLALADPNDPRTRVVITMRRDYYNLISTFPEIYNRLETDSHRARQILGRISTDGLRRIVTEPLHLAGMPEGDRIALANQVAAEMGDRPGDLALVQMALTETWDRRRSFGDDLLRAYAGIGRIEGAIARAAEDVYTYVLDDAERTLAEPVFVRLVRLGDTSGATRRLATRVEFNDAKWRLVQKLASKEAKRLVLIGGSERTETAEIAHEALVSQWPRYQTWLSGRDPDGADRAADKRVLDALTYRAAGWAAAPDAFAKDQRLATGADLETFVGLAGRRPIWLSADEHQFVLDSQEAARRQQHREQKLLWEAKRQANLAQQREQEASAERDKVQAAIGRLLGTEAQRRLAGPITQDTSSLIAALATTGWRLGKASDAWNAMQRVPSVTTLARIDHNYAVTAITFSSDGQFLATASEDTTRRYSDTARYAQSETRLVAVADGRELARIAHDDAVTAVAFSPDGKSLAIASRDKTVRLVAVADGRERARVTHDGAVTALAFSPDGQFLATASEDNTARILAVADGRELARTDGREFARTTYYDAVTAVAFSPDSQFLAIASGAAIDLVSPIKAKAEATIVAVADGRELARITHDDWITAVAFSPDGKILATASRDKTVRLVAVADGCELARIAHDDAVTAVAFRPDGQFLATASEDKTARLVAVVDGRERARVTHDGAVTAVAFSSDGQFLATASEDKTARLVAVVDGRERARITHYDAVRAVAFNPGGKILATASEDKTARLVAVVDGRERALITHDGAVTALAFSPDGQFLATASGDYKGKKGEARLVAVVDGRERARITHDDAVREVAFSPDSQFLATRSADETVRLMAVADGRELARIAHDDAVTTIRFSPDGRFLATASGYLGVNRYLGVKKGEARLVAVVDGRERARITYDDAVREVAFSPDSQFLATRSADETVRLMAVADGRELARIAHDGAVTAVAFSPDGKILATASEDKTVRLMAVADGRERARVTHDGAVTAVAFSLDGQFLATRSEDKTVRLMAVADGRERARVIHDGAVTAVAFSPDSQFLATRSEDKTVRLMAVADGRELARIAHDDAVTTMRFSPDGQFLATGSKDKTARLVAVVDGRELAHITHDGAVTAVAFSPDGKYFATANDKAARLWSADLDDMLHQLCTGPGRNLSHNEWRRYLGDLPWQPTCENWPTPKD